MSTTSNQRHHVLREEAHGTRVTRILALNPNSSPAITQAMAHSIAERGIPAGCEIVCATAPPNSPESINDPPTSIASTHACMEAFRAADTGAGDAVFDLKTYDAVLVACFSAHPLVGCLRHIRNDMPSMHILEAAILSAMSATSGKFGIVTTGRAMVSDVDAGARAVLGGHSDRYAGSIATNLPVLHLQDAQHALVVKETVEAAARTLAERGVGAIILGCAGMAGMEPHIRSGAAQLLTETEAAQIAVIDGTIAGCHLLAGLARSKVWQ